MEQQVWGPGEYVALVSIALGGMYLLSRLASWIGAWLGRLSGNYEVAEESAEPDSAPMPPVIPVVVMSPERWRQIKHRQVEGIRQAKQRREAWKEAWKEVQKSAIERDIRERQDRALRTYAGLPKRKGKVEITDTLLSDLMGINTKTFYARLKEYREDIAEVERVRAIPHDPELETMEPVPA